jgi:antitoxin component of MazEF toxin-antitoxin module
MNAKIVRYGNALTVSIPATLVSELSLQDGDCVRMHRVEDGILIELPGFSRLKARLATVPGRESEIGSGRSLGAESLDAHHRSE